MFTVVSLFIWDRKYGTNALHLQYILCMVLTKTATLNLRIDPVLKELIRIAAKNEHRSVANLIEVLIRQHCEREGITVPEQQEMFAESNND